MVSLFFFFFNVFNFYLTKKSFVGFKYTELEGEENMVALLKSHPGILLSHFVGDYFTALDFGRLAIAYINPEAGSV